MNAQPAPRAQPARAPADAGAAAPQKPWRSAPIEEQIEALKRAQEGQRRYHRKIMTVGSNANPTWYRLEDWRLSSAIRTLEALRDSPAGGAP